MIHTKLDNLMINVDGGTRHEIVLLKFVPFSAAEGAVLSCCFYAKLLLLGFYCRVTLRGSFNPYLPPTRWFPAGFTKL